jgi:hypothetical protein
MLSCECGEIARILLPSYFVWGREKGDGQAGVGSGPFLRLPTVSDGDET